MPDLETTTQSEKDSLLATLCAEISETLRSGSSVDLEEYADRWPQHIDELRQLLPAMMALVKLPDDLADCDRSELEHALAAPLGDFQILRQIGRGGMGVVYEALQLSLGRRVALKVLPQIGAMDERQLARFKNEATAAAGLLHAHIVPVYAVGAERGVHYYAMQRIYGQNLAEVVAELRIREGLDQPADATGELPSDSIAWQLSVGESLRNEQAVVETIIAAGTQTRPQNDRRRELTTYFRNVAALAKDAADALAFAHEEGLIHRDIKPSNLMLDAAGKLWVTDFGLARTQATTGMTLTGDLVGTLRYMSPEQAMGSGALVDHRTDLYSLGATLHELLTLRPMVSGDGQAEIVRNVTSVEPLPVRRLRPEIPVDLENIVLKAVAKSPSDRYRTMQDLAEDLGRFLRNEPVKARPLGMLDRGARFVRRNSLAFAGALAVTMLMAAGLGIAFYLTYLARMDAELKGREAAQTGQDLQRRHEQMSVVLGQVNRAVDTMLEQLRSLPVGDAVRQAIAEQELAFYQELQAIDQDSPGARNQLALSLHRLGHLQIDQKRFAEAEETLQESIAVFEELLAAEPGSLLYANSLCHAWMNLGRAAMLQNQLEIAVDRMQKSLHYGKLATTLDPLNPEVRLAVAFPWGQLGRIRAAQGMQQEALDAHQREIELHSQNVAARPDHWQYRLLLSAAHLACAETWFRFHDTTTAKPHIEASLTELRVIAKQRPDDALIRHRIGWSLTYGIAIPTFTAEQRNTMWTELEQIADFHASPDADRVLNWAAWAACWSATTSTVDSQFAVKLAQKAVAASEKSATYWNTLGVAQYRCGNDAESLQAFEQSGLCGNLKVAYDSFFEAMCHERLGRHEQAVECFREAVNWMQVHEPENPELIAFRQEATQLLGIKE